MNLNINTAPLTNANADRGVGQYTRMLIESIKLHTDIDLVDSQEQADVVHYPFFDLFFLTLPFRKLKPTVVTVHDVIPLLYPKQYPKGVRGTIKQLIQTKSLAGANRIVTDSDCSTRDVVSYLSQPAEKVETVYLAPDPDYGPAAKRQIKAVREKYGLSKQYFLYVGDINYNKNVPGLFAAFSQFDPDYTLVLVSKTLRRDNPAAEFLWQEVDRLGIGNRLTILSDVPIEEMRPLYSGAFWYVQASLYEGFGLPVLEAQACGCPVISTDGGSLKEIAGSSCLHFDLFQSVGEIDRNQFIQRGFVNVQRFSWQKTAQMMKDIYASVE